MQILLKKLRKLRPGNLLAILFVIYLGYVAVSCIPQTIYEFGRCLYWRTGVQEFITAVDTQSTDLLSIEQDQPLLLNKGTYINLNGLMARILKQPHMNNRIRLTNGHLTHEPGPTSQKHIQTAADNVIHFYNAHTANGGKFLFIVAPTQLSKYENYLPVGYTDTVNGPADDFLALLEQAGVPYLDLREELQNDGISITDAYYVTDHHWTPETGLWAYGKIIRKLETMGAIAPVDPFYTDPNNFSFITYKDAFLGSSGKRTGRYFAGLDDATYIHPNFETNISISMPHRELQLQGRFEDVSYHLELNYDFEHPDYFNKNFYAAYGWNDNPITHWRNPQAPDQSKVMLIGESFGNIPFSLMSLSLGVCDEVDMRHFTEDFQEYYENYQPDTVILEVNSGAIISQFTDTAYLD